ncbi:MAG: 30S ribosomal protein S3 [Deltaproteobacteria bacterium]|nr:MAG: 30S ribosomal protein S3 [Deltaproteobacteria bacterium]
MGQKVHPIGLRLGINRTWNSRWFAGSEFASLVIEDNGIRGFLKKRLSQAGISKVEIDRAANKVRLRIYTSRPGIIIGKRGAEIENLRKEIEKKIKREVFIDIKEVRRPEVEAQLAAENIAIQLVRRVAFRRAMKKSVASAMRFGAKGIKISCSGRLGGAEMGRREWYREGRVPLHTLRADIDYGFAEAFTTYGVIGVKVTIFKGEIWPDKIEEEFYAKPKKG